LAKEGLTREGIENKILLRTDGEGRNAWHIAACKSKLYVIQKIWELAKERLTTEEIKMKCYYAQIVREGTPGTLQHIGTM
jgi:hypothetical protein